MRTAVPMTSYPAAAWYVRNWREGKAAVQAGQRINIGRMGEYGYDLDEPAFNREMWRALDARINQRGGIVHVGRKWANLWQEGAARDARAINDHFGKRTDLRLCNLSTLEVRKRFSGRIPRDYSEE